MEFDVQVQNLLATPKCSSLLADLTANALACTLRCRASNEPSACDLRCNQPTKMWEDFIAEKRLIYVKRGAVFCKQSCWEVQELKPCLKKCYAEYSKLLPELEELVTNKLEELILIE
jgi:hypothetical protein